MEGLGAAASVIAVVDLAGKVATVLFRYLTAVKHAKPDIERLCNEIDQFTTTLQNAQRLLNGPKAGQLQTANSQPLRQALNGSYLELVSLEGKLTKKLESSSSRVMSKFGIRGLKWPFESREVDRIITALERQRDTLSAALTIDQVEQTFNIDQTLALSKLPVVEDALFDSQANEHESRCHPDTRVDLLQDIYRWVDSTDPASKSVFYLQGMAGTGKSTISRTRGEGDCGNASRVITTLTSHLIAKEPSLAANVKLAIDANHAIASKPMDEQFDQLILAPLSKLDSQTRKPKTVIVIIDALDECGEEDDIRRLVYQISRGAALDSIQWTAFLTGRPELPVRLGIDVIRGNVEQRQLELVPEADIHHDLTSFFTTRFANIRDDFNRLSHDDSRLPQGWLVNEVTQQLVHRAIPLFIFAATVCRFIEDRAWSDPRAQLGKILHHATAFVEMDNLEATYLPILSQLAVSSKFAQQRLYNEFSNVIGSIVVLAEPLSANSLSRVLGLPRSTIDRRLMPMHSVLRVPESPDMPIKMLHISFRDFLIDLEKRQQNPFWIDEKAVHAKLADSCLDFLSSQNHLRKDICDLGSPERKPGCNVLLISTTTGRQRELDRGQVGATITALSPNETTIAWVGADETVSLDSLQDIDTGMTSLKLVRPAKPVSRLFFSHDGELLAFIDDDYDDQIWNTISGDQLFAYSSKNVLVVALSPGGRFVGTISFRSEGVVDIWDITGKDDHSTTKLKTETYDPGSQDNELHEHEDTHWVMNVTFSPNGKTVASVGRDDCVCTWDPKRAKGFESFNTNVESTKFSIH
ncbi:hypothetical protein BJY04DRAFT_223393 [Aspergillus karnatakaensis]|uniref:WD40 repeat domain-containing protein n=1 Tax=Aspergillus karnatakaensis TaxID=1810916 RepID=UPI003CCD4C6B